MEDSKRKLNKKTAILALAFLSMASTVAFIEKEVFVGAMSILGLFLFMIYGEGIQTRYEGTVFSLTLWMALSFRYATLLGTYATSVLTVAGCMIPLSLFWSCCMIFSGMLKRHGHYIFSVICFPTGFTLSVILAVFWNLGNIHNIATYVMCLTPISQNMSVVGEFPMTFTILTVMSLLSEGIASDSIKQRRRYISIGLAIVIALMISGSVLTLKKTEPDYFLNVAVATHEKMDFTGQTDREYTNEDRKEIFRNAVEEASENNADILILCEEYCTVEKDLEKSNMDFYSKVIKEYGVPVLVSIDLINEGDKGEEINVNKALYFDKDGNVCAEYIKNNLVPFIESPYYEDGPEDPAYLKCEIGDHKVNLSYVICFDINDDDYMKRIPKDTELLIVPSWDWHSCNIEQKRTFIRSIELNTTMIKHTYEGFTFVSGPYGLYGDMLDNRGMYETVRMINVPIWEK